MLSRASPPPSGDEMRRAVCADMSHQAVDTALWKEKTGETLDRHVVRRRRSSPVGISPVIFTKGMTQVARGDRFPDTPTDDAGGQPSWPRRLLALGHRRDWCEGAPADPAHHPGSCCRLGPCYKASALVQAGQLEKLAAWSPLTGTMSRRQWHWYRQLPQIGSSRRWLGHHGGG